MKLSGPNICSMCDEYQWPTFLYTVCLQSPLQSVLCCHILSMVRSHLLASQSEIQLSTAVMMGLSW